MKELILLLAIIHCLTIAIAIPILIIEKKKKNQRRENEEAIPQVLTNQQFAPTIETDYRNKYQKRLLLTKNEYFEYKKLKTIAEKKGLIICPKIRLLDLVEPRRGDPNQKTYLYKIQSKHVDFVICDQNLYVKAILEIDDNSHNTAERKERDQFVDTVLRSVGYVVIRTRSITETTLDSIT